MPFYWSTAARPIGQILQSFNFSFILNGLAADVGQFFPMLRRSSNGLAADVGQLFPMLRRSTKGCEFLAS
jgi:hypothetical protein